MEEFIMKTLHVAVEADIATSDAISETNAAKL